MNRISKKILLFILFLIAAEAYLRYGMKPRFALDNNVLFTLSKNCRYIRTNFRVNGGEKIIVHTNSMGYRGKEISPKKNNKRVVVYGDSFILGDFTHIEDTFCKQLEKLMRSDIDPNIEVINAGVAGYGPDQISLKLEEELKTLDPDLVVIAVYSGNDFGDLLRNKIYKIGENGCLNKTDYFLDKTLLKNFYKKISITTPRILIFSGKFIRDFTGYIGNEMPNRMTSFKKIMGTFLYVFDLIEEKVFFRDKATKNNELRDAGDYISDSLVMAENEYDEVINKNDNSVKTLFADHYDADLSMFPEKESSQYKKKLMSQVLVKIASTLKQADVPCVFIFIPSPIDICNYYDYKVDTDKNQYYEPSRLTDVLEEIAVKNKLNFINLYRYFDKKDPDSLFFTHGNIHWNKKGQKLAAEIVKDYLIEKEAMQDENSDITI